MAYYMASNLHQAVWNLSTQKQSEVYCYVGSEMVVHYLDFLNSCNQVHLVSYPIIQADD